MKNNFIPMWVINVTPNSFSDAGQWINGSHDWTKQVASFEGQVVIDVGAESTAPGKNAVSSEEEIRRLDQHFFSNLTKVKRSLHLSLDTYKVETMDWCLERLKEFPQVRSVIWNDVSGMYQDGVVKLLKHNEQLLYILTHNKVVNREQVTEHHLLATPLNQTSNIVSEVVDFFNKALLYFKNHHLDKRIILDPALGFAKNRDQNWQLIKKLPSILRDFHQQDFLIGISRKSFLRDLGKTYKDELQADKALMKESLILKDLIINKPYTQKIYWRTHHICLIEYLNQEMLK